MTFELNKSHFIQWTWTRSCAGSHRSHWTVFGMVVNTVIDNDIQLIQPK